MSFLGRAFLCAGLALSPLAAYGATPAPQLSAADKADVARVEEYLNSIHTVAARFLQSTSEGNDVQGSYNNERTAKKREQNQPPQPRFIVASAFYH